MTGQGRASTTRPDPEAALRSAGYFMYSLFVPDTMQRLMADAGCSLTVATDDLELPWELMHAGHAAFDRLNPEQSALLLHENARYFAQKIQRILEGRPLVFLNACETSTTANEEDETATTYVAAEAQGLAAAFIYGGASACVGSLWPVYDDTRARFAIAFYNALFEGDRIGEALRLARWHVRRQYSDRVTWASYALYGDPTVRLPFLPVAKESMSLSGAGAISQVMPTSL